MHRLRPFILITGTLLCVLIAAAFITSGSWMLPLCPVFAAALLVTLLVWRFVPMPVRPGHCECGYNLTGNTSGMCPDCGREAATETG